MLKRFEFIKDKSFKITVVGGISVLFIWTILQWIFNMLAGLNILPALKAAVDFFGTRVSVAWLVIVVGLFSLLNSYSIYTLKKNFGNKFVKKDELNNKLQNKLDTSAFYGFRDIYDYRRLKNHPYHELYTGHSNNIRSFIQMIDFGMDRSLGYDGYSIDNGISGLIDEIKEQNFIQNSDKSEIINLLSKYKPNEYNAKREELLKLLNEISTI